MTTAEDPRFRRSAPAPGLPPHATNYGAVNGGSSAGGDASGGGASAEQGAFAAGASPYALPGQRTAQGRPALTVEPGGGSGAKGHDSEHRPLDLAGVGIGPANLSLAALADGVPGLRAACYEQRAGFAWHPGMLIEGATLQVPFLADLVTLADPASRWSFLSYLKAQDRLFPFYFGERFHIERTEYDAYCRWVCEGLATAGPRAVGGPGKGRGGARGSAAGPGLHFGHRVDAVRWHPGLRLFELDFTRTDADAASQQGRSYARNLVLGVGTAPYVPEPLRALAASTGAGAPVVHSAGYLEQRERLLAAGHVTVVGSGQSGAEVFLDLLRNRPAGREGLHWITRSGAFAPMEYSKLGLEHFTPDYTRYFHGLRQSVRDELVPRQWQLHKAVDHGTLAAIHDELYHRTLGGGWPDAVITPGVAVRTAGRVGATRVELHLEQAEQDVRTRLVTDAVVLATGYRERPLDGVLASLEPWLARDDAERLRIDEHYRLVMDPSVRGAVYVQNAERHTHGVGAPDLGLVAHRSAVILNSLTGEEHYRLPRRTAFTTFGLRPEGALAAGTPGVAEQADRRHEGFRPLRMS
ncbi:lysine N6-hydroxylase [Streptomyces sp. WMMB 714]|uniref:lysine N(6)-hydroxylase/L-ornithine N(5)-oxygenase family protein n=1 Tax=Streptomyces sp. WMMB 714 TaxID=1286822 RepID=UPI000823E258|nr:SidA/IucD/PvdA family monooxygenase [Streptomyces sp. WMMB 714]SCK29333.1 lysine N6-hydroxylase [Streptomyces sp. WMMB 714]